MCTLVVAFYPGTPNPLIIGANRDEDPTRPATEWAYRSPGLHPYTAKKINLVYSPLDVGGGTWIGTSIWGSFCAITNWDISDEHLKGMKSKGKVVLESLYRRDPRPYWESLKAEEHKPFNILWGDRFNLYHLQCDHKEITINKLPPGLHISTGWGMNSESGRDSYAREYLANEFGGNFGGSFRQPISSFAIKGLMSIHNASKGSEHSMCVHDEEHRWETRSSSLLVLDKERWSSI